MASTYVKEFDFITFLKDITNQYIPELQDNTKYDDIISGVADIFSKLYKRAQEITIMNTVDINSDRDFVKYIDGNEHIIDEESKPYSDILLEFIALYLNTDHFKDTLAVLMRLWQTRQEDNGKLGENQENLEDFIERYIVPSFRFFTMNSGDLHKSKGVKVLLERLLEFYGEVEVYDPSFTGVDENDDDDFHGKRFIKFTSLKEGITLKSVIRNYQDTFNNINLIISKYIELNVHRFVLAEGYLFISRKDRDDWHIINIVDDIYKVCDEGLIIKRNKTISLYKDDFDLYDSETNEFILPDVDTLITDSNVEFVPKIINLSDKFNEYHDTNLYYITKNTISDVDIYSLKRIKYRILTKIFYIEVIQEKMSISYLDILNVAETEYPQATQLNGIEYLWLDFYDEEDTIFNFYPNDSYPESRECVKFLHSFQIEIKTRVPDPEETFLYFSSNFIGTIRDGYQKQIDVNESSHASYNILYKTERSISDKYSLVERHINEVFESELNKIIGDEIYVRSVLDMFTPVIVPTYNQNKYSYQGKWDANNESQLSPSTTPEDGFYWEVSNDGNILLNGISVWTYGDIIVWNGDLECWEKNNSIKTIVEGTSNTYEFDHKLIIISDHEKEGEELTSSPFDSNCGLFFIQLSSIPINISNFSQIYSIDVNSNEKFGDDGNILILYKDKSDGFFYLYFIRTDGFFRENNIINLRKVLKDFPKPLAIAKITKCEVNDKILLVYCEKFTNIVGSKSEIIFCDNIIYDLPHGIRNNIINMSYNADVQLSTRQNQTYFVEYNLVDNEKIYVEDQEVSAFKTILDRYAPVNTYKDQINANIDLAISTQEIEDGQSIESFFVNQGSYGYKELKEVSILSHRDDLVLDIFGSPESVNCACNKQNLVLYLSNYDILTPFYDWDTNTVFDGLTYYPYECCSATKIGKVNDEYSNYEDVCRFDTNYIYFMFEDGNSVPRLGRQRFFVNLFDEFQSVIVSGATETLNYNWSIRTIIEVLEDDNLDTLGYKWVNIFDEEIYKPIITDGECSPVGIYYNYNEESSALLTAYTSWDVFDIPACAVSTLYNCTFEPWTPDISDFVKPDLIDIPDMEDTYDPEEDVYVQTNDVKIIVFRRNDFYDGYSITGNIISGSNNIPVSIIVNRGEYTADPNLKSKDYVLTEYSYNINNTVSLSGTALIYDTRSKLSEEPHIGRLQIFVNNSLEYDSGFRNGSVKIDI